MDHDPSGGAHGGFRFHLKRVTEPEHQALETRMARTGLDGSLASYRRLLTCFHSLYDPLERALEQLDWTATGLDPAARRKSPWLAEDLAHFGETVPTRPISAALPPVRGIGDGFGVLYVLEGATLGGQIISRELRAGLGIGPESGGRFFAGYGAETGRMWQSFVAVLERAAEDPENASAISEAASATFRSFDRALAALETTVDAASNIR